jgi:hypothetical protein
MRRPATRDAGRAPVEPLASLIADTNRTIVQRIAAKTDI